MRKLLVVAIALFLSPALIAQTNSVEFTGWHYPDAKSCDEAKQKFEANYKTYKVLTDACAKKVPKGVLGNVLSYSCFMGNGKNGFPGGAVVTATVACNCKLPPSTCPAGKTQVGTWTAPSGPGWGGGTWAVCLESTAKQTTQWCQAAYYPNSDHSCDDYKGWSSVVNLSGKKYCVYNRTNSQYYKAVEVYDPIIVSYSPHYPQGVDCAKTIAEWKQTFKTSPVLQNSCKAKAPNSKPSELVSIECGPAPKPGFNGGTLVKMTVKCE